MAMLAQVTSVCLENRELGANGNTFDSAHSPSTLSCLTGTSTTVRNVAREGGVRSARLPFAMRYWNNPRKCEKENDIVDSWVEFCSFLLDARKLFFQADCF